MFLSRKKFEELESEVRSLSQRFSGLQYEVFMMTKEIKKLKSKLPTIKIGFIHGHNEQKQGATNVFGMTEFEWSKKLFKNYFSEIINVDDTFNLELVPIERTGRTYREEVESVVLQCKKHNLNFCVEEHFNACGDKEVRGCEVLILLENAYPFSTKEWKIMRQFADDITDDISKTFKTPERGQDGVRYISPSFKVRGGGMLGTLEKHQIYSCIIEPAFCYNEEFFKRDNEYAKILKDNLLKMAKSIYELSNH